jgi:hypothetical protein
MVAQCRISGRKTIDAKQAHGSAQGGSIDEQREQHVFLLTALITTAFGARAFSLFVLLPTLRHRTRSAPAKCRAFCYRIGDRVRAAKAAPYDCKLVVEIDALGKA